MDGFDGEIYGKVAILALETQDKKFAVQIRTHNFSYFLRKVNYNCKYVNYLSHNT